MNKPIVLLDVDGVIADFSAEYYRLACQIAHRTLTGPEEWDDWDMKVALGLNEQEVRYIHTHLNRPGVAEGFSPYYGAVDGVHELMRKEICDLYFLTSPIETSPTWCHDRTMWLVAHFGLEQGRKVIHTHYKHLVKGDFFIDDRPSNVTNWGGANAGGTPLLWDMRFNRGFHHLTRVYGWTELIKMVSEHE